jgi:hypothetical protein
VWSYAEKITWWNILFLDFIDDCTKYTWVYFMRKKSDVFEYFKEFKNMVEKKIGKYIKILQSDQGRRVYI